MTLLSDGLGSRAVSVPELLGTTILVVDDLDTNLELLRRILTNAGAATVHTTTDPLRGADLYRDAAPDLVLLDLHMPGVDGLALMGMIRDLTAPDDLVPIIVLTADCTPAARDKVLAAGANDFLSKPFDTTEVVLRARNLLHTRALHAGLRASNATLTAEVERRGAAETRARDEDARKRASIQRALDSHAPRMVFQPVARISSGAVVGYEALARFDLEPRRPPNEWFADAASVDLGAELELAAASAALSQLDAIPAAQFLTVNVSPATATNGSFAELVGRYRAERIVIEITEHTRIDDYAPLLRVLERLRSDGVRLAVDDAGSGFASLNHILKLRPDIIKLDITLTRDIDADPIRRALASSLVTFGYDIGSTLIAEGIETAQELHALDELGVPFGQGYYIARPGDLAAVPHVTSN
jgi:EAL domain-containing protein (putative c-di-GMP-specific phosphodiesterase class I)/DNA-binding NarL/FixJ family response regulator